MAQEQSNALTVPGFWDGFWGSVKLPVLPDPTKRYERCFLDVFARYLPRTGGLSVFEAGCAPGMWLAYFAREFGYRVFGVDSSPKGVALTEENLKLCGVSGSVVCGDFFAYRADEAFDLVMSLGFIEHFTDPAPALEKHLSLLKPGGLLILEVPNLTGFNAWLQTPEVMAIHNQAVMSEAFFRDFAREHGLETVFLEYIGGFEPDNLGPPRSALFKRILLKALRLVRRLPGAGRLNSPHFSGFLLGVFRMPPAKAP